jgi:large subunit ribosomal protein L1
MPNLKLGTVTKEIVKTVQEYKKGKLEYRNDKQGNIQLSIGKVSFDDAKISENILSVIDLVRSKKPPTVKGTYISNVSISTTMGPGIKVEIPLA